MSFLYSIKVLNLWFMHFSWGKIWFDIFPPCKQNDILQLWTDSRLTSYWVSTDSSDSQLTFYQCPTRALFQLSRRDREYLSFNLVSETGSRISFFRSHASRRDRDFLSFNLVLRDEHENFFLSISCFETSTRIFPPNLRLRDESEKFCHFVSVFETRTGFFLAFIFV